MAVTSVKERASGRDGDRTPEGGTIRRSFIVRTDNHLTAQSTILNDARIPRLFSYYYNGGEVNLAYVAKKITPRQIDGSLYDWEVTVEYESKTSENEEQQNPTLRPAVYTWSTQQATVELLVDADDREVENSIGDPFDPAIETSRSFEVVTIERNESSFDGHNMGVYINSLNRSDIFGYSPREGRIESISARSNYDPDFGTYFSVTYEIHFRNSYDWVPKIPAAQILPSGKQVGPWDVTRRNVGWRYKKSANCNPSSEVSCIRAAETQGFQDPIPVDLAENGTKLNPGDPALYWVFEPYLTFSWTKLHLEP